MDTLQKKANEIKEARKDPATENIGDGYQPTSSPIIDEAHAAAERMEKANQERAALLEKEEKLVAVRALGGRALAGEEIKPKTKEEQVQAIADDMMKQITE